MRQEVRIEVFAGAQAPEYKTAEAAGADLRAHLEAPIILAPGKRMAVPTGIRLELPPGFEAQIRPRSGLALEHGISCLNSPGTIDSDYRGEIKVILANFGDKDFQIRSGDRIAQMIIAPVIHAVFVESELGKTERGSNGFGSTGK